MKKNHSYFLLFILSTVCINCMHRKPTQAFGSTKGKCPSRPCKNKHAVVNKSTKYNQLLNAKKGRKIKEESELRVCKYFYGHNLTENLGRTEHLNSSRFFYQGQDLVATVLLFSILVDKVNYAIKRHDSRADMLRNNSRYKNLDLLEIGAISEVY